MSKKLLTILIIVAVALMIIGGITVGTVLILRNRDSQKENGSSDEYDPTDEDKNTPSKYADYPELEPMIGKTLDEIKAEFPGGEDQVSNTTWGEKWYSYRYENDLFELNVDGKATKVVDFAGMVVKEFTGCVRNETVLDLVDEIVPYAGINPDEIGTATNPGIYEGLASFYQYKQGYAISVMCSNELDGSTTLQVSYFTVPDYYFDN